MQVALLVQRQRLWIISISLALVATLILTWLPELDRAAQDYLANALSDNLVVYASARTLNALISVIQSIEISFSLGAGVAVNLGEVLDPLNDLIERFSAFILYALAGLGLQQLALTASSSVFTKVLLSMALVIGFLWWLVAEDGLPKWAKKLLLFLLMVRFIFAVEVGVSWLLDKAYFEVQQQEAISTLDIAKSKLESVQDQYIEAADERGMFGSIWDTARQIVGGENQDGIADLAAGAIVQLIVIMLVHSILLPVFFVWLMFYLFRRFIPE
ncbi:MAG: hypothetical protein ACFHHU_14780 [Porticoccaceae bacterium]